MLDLIGIGKRIAEIREGKGLTQTALAQKLGLSRTAISRLENGQRDISFAEMRLLSQILLVDPDDLIHNDLQEEQLSYLRKTMPEQVIGDLEKINEIINSMLGFEHLFHRFKKMEEQQ
jgi:transcriptional regulator with XRE-family HTH domain